jgi:hypothetical protein
MVWQASDAPPQSLKVVKLLRQDACTSGTFHHAAARPYGLVKNPTVAQMQHESVLANGSARSECEIVARKVGGANGS